MQSERSKKSLLFFEVPLDAEHSGTQRTVTGFCKGDNESKSLRITLHQSDGVPYSIPDTCTAVLFGKKPDETCFMHNCTLEDGRAIYVPTAQTVAAIGTVACQLVVYGTNNEVLFTPRFSIEVEAPVRDTEELESTDEFTALDDLLFRLNAAFDLTDEKCDAADAALGSLAQKEDSLDAKLELAQDVIAEMQSLIETVEDWNPEILSELSETTPGTLQFKGKDIANLHLVQTAADLPEDAAAGQFVYVLSGASINKGFYYCTGTEDDAAVWVHLEPPYMHTHNNTAVLNRFSGSAGRVTYNGAEIPLVPSDTVVPLELKYYDTLQFRENMAEVPVFIYDRIGFGIELYSADETEYIRYTDVTDADGLPVPFLTVVTDGHEYTCWFRDYESTYWGDRDAGWYETTDGTETAMENPPLVENFTPAKFVVGVDPVTLENIVYTDLSNLPPKAASALRSLSQMVNVDAASMGEIDVPDGAIVRFAGVLEAGQHYNFDTSADVLTLTFPSVGWTTEDMQTVLDLHCVEDVRLTLPREKLLVDGAVPSTKAGDHRLIFTYVKSAGKFAVDGLNQITPPNWEVPDQVIPFGECTWDQIKAVAMHGYKSADGQWYIMRNGQREIWWEIGDEKTITLDGGEQVTLQIYDFNHDDLADNSGKAPLTIGMKNCLSDSAVMNLTSTNEGGWYESYMRTYTMRQIYDKLPSELRQIVAEVYKYSDTGYGTGPSAVVDKLFLLSTNELSGTEGYDWRKQGTKYPIFTTDESRIKSVNGTAKSWWTRTSTSSSNGNYVNKNVSFVLDTGSIYGQGWGANRTDVYVCFAFCI